MQKNAWTYALSGTVLGAFGLLLRWLQCEIIFDENGLPAKNAPMSWLLVIYMVIMVAVLWWLAGRICSGPTPEEPEEVMAAVTREATVFLVLGAAAVALGAAYMFLRIYDTIFRVTALMGILSAPVMALYPSLNRWGGFGAGLSLIPVAFFAVWLVAFYKTNAVDPTLWNYAMEILAIAGCLLASYRCSAYLFYRADARHGIFACAVGTAFSLMVLMDQITAGERILFAGWAICFGVLCWILVRSFPADTEKEQNAGSAE